MATQLTDRVMHPDDARNVIGLAEEDPEIERDQVLLAGQSLAAEVRRLEGELERAQVWRRAASARGGMVEGAPLELGYDGGGRRHFLAGRPVHAGAGMSLLTDIGWMPGRYEWSYNTDDYPRFYFYLPGMLQDVSVPITAWCRLAWPDELGQR